jgi:uncharacterized membrane protein YgcG
MPRLPSDAAAAAAAAAAAGAPPPPRGCVSVATNDVARAFFELESAAFESALSPRVAVRLLHALAAGLAAKFLEASGRRLSWLEALFEHLEEYLGRDALDAALALEARAEGAGGGRLRLHLSGLGGGPGGGSGGGGGGSAAVSLVNDVDLLTVLDTVQLLAAAS